MLIMYESSTWTRITTYVAENRTKMAQDAKLQTEMINKDKNMTESNAWTRIVAYVPDKQEKWPKRISYTMNWSVKTIW